MARIIPAISESILCPFTITIDSREQQPYTFDSIHANADRKHAPIIVTTAKHGLPVGDYSIEGLAPASNIIIERKSKEDLFSSVVRRANFVGRLERMQADYQTAVVVVEAELSEIYTRPPPFSKLPPRSLGRTIFAWICRYKVHWIFAPNRDFAESMTFRLLERHWLDYQALQATQAAQAGQAQQTSQARQVKDDDANPSIQTGDVKAFIERQFACWDSDLHGDFDLHGNADSPSI